jgi:hypothetical protein
MRNAMLSLLRNASMVLVAGALTAGLAFPELQTFSNSSCPIPGPLTEGAFTATVNGNGFCGPVQNLGLASDSEGATITLTANGFKFDATSILVGGVNSAIPSEPVTFTGDIAGGGTVTQIFDTTGSTTSFAEADLHGFDNLTDLRITLVADSIQNLTFNVSTAPEPGTFALVGLGLAGLAIVRRKRSA